MADLHIYIEIQSFIEEQFGGEVSDEAMPAFVELVMGPVYDNLSEAVSDAVSEHTHTWELSHPPFSVDAVRVTLIPKEQNNE